MSGGVEWAYAQQKAEEEYNKHVKSGYFNKNYLETDIVNKLNKDEITLLVDRLIIHQLGGTLKFFEDKLALSAFYSLSKKKKIQ